MHHIFHPIMPFFARSATSFAVIGYPERLKAFEHWMADPSQLIIITVPSH